MARTADTRYCWRVRALSPTLRRSAERAGWFAVVFALVILICPAIASADPLKGEATFSASGGFARLVLKFSEDVVTEVTPAGSIIVIRFERPVDLPVDKLAEAVTDYVGSARRDPDGMAIRLSLARRVSINTMTAGERVFVDFLPDSWSGPPPGLPQDVVRDRRVGVLELLGREVRLHGRLDR